jgi:RNA polymerase primary sigma factor
MIAGLCESPLTFQAIIIWRDELNEGKVFLRDIIDLEATYAGPDAKAMPALVIGPDGQPIVAAPAGATPFKGAPERANGEDGSWWPSSVPCRRDRRQAKTWPNPVFGLGNQIGAAPAREGIADA